MRTPCTLPLDPPLSHDYVIAKLIKSLLLHIPFALMTSRLLHSLVVPGAEELSNRLLVVHTLRRKILDPPVV